jgi:hypothetical protein
VPDKAAQTIVVGNFRHNMVYLAAPAGHSIGCILSLGEGNSSLLMLHQRKILMPVLHIRHSFPNTDPSDMGTADKLMQRRHLAKDIRLRRSKKNTNSIADFRLHRTDTESTTFCGEEDIALPQSPNMCHDWLHEGALFWTEGAGRCLVDRVAKLCHS